MQNLKNKLTKTLLLGGLALTLASCSNVRTGNITRCKDCSKELSNTVQSLTVPFWEASKYNVSESYNYCNECGNREVPYKILYKCKDCDEVLREETALVLRRDEHRDVTIRNDYCSRHQPTLGKKASEAFGRWLGNAAGGLEKGMGEGYQSGQR